MDLRHGLAALAVMFVAGHAPSPGQSQTVMVDVLAWRIKPGTYRPNDYWINGLVRNRSTHRLTGVRLRFNILTGGGALLGESDALIKLSTLLPGQECEFAAPVEIHDRRMRKMVLMAVKVDTADDVLLYRDVPFSTPKKFSYFRNTLRDAGLHKSPR